MRTELCKATMWPGKSIIKNPKNSCNKTNYLYFNISYLGKKRGMMGKKHVGENVRLSCKTFVVKGWLDQKAGRKIPRMLLAISNKFLQNIHSPFPKGKKRLRMSFTRAPQGKCSQMGDSDPEIRS